MALKFALAALVATATLTEAHYTFARLRHNGEWQGPYQYIRNKTDRYLGDGNEPGNSVPYRGFHWPTLPGDRPESVRCGRDNMLWASQTEVLTIQAGDTFEIAADAGELPSQWAAGNQKWDNCPDDRGACLKGTYDWVWHIIHFGPVLVHLSRVPDGQDVREYDGSGEWTKIFTLGAEWRKDDPNWPLYWLAYNGGNVPPRIVFQIPPQTPPGDYLMRMDQIWDGRRESSQLYPSCAQLRIESKSTAKLPKGVRIPEVFSPSSPGMNNSKAMVSAQQLDEGYVYPGGLLWNGKELLEDKPSCPEGDPTACKAV